MEELNKKENFYLTKNNCILPVIAVLLLLAGNFIAQKAEQPLFKNIPPITEINPTPLSASLDMAAFALGSRHVFADIWLIRILIYYGNHNNGTGHANSADEVYQEFYERAMHIARLDPSFRSANTLSAAIMAFNMAQYENAEKLLNYVLKYQPKQRFYTQMMLSIAQKKKGDPDAVLESILPIIKDPECPALIKNVTALLYRRAGRWQEAAALYIDIIQNSKEKEYIEKAYQGLKELEQVRLGGEDPIRKDLENL